MGAGFVAGSSAGLARLASAPAFLGREKERAAGARFLRLSEQGPAGFLIQGDDGAGKSALLSEIVAGAGPETLVLSSCPTESEGAMSYSTVADLLTPVAEQVLRSIPEPQRQALEAVLLLGHPSPDGHDRAVAAGLGSVLSVLASSSPVLVAIDDVQWIDHSSAVVLGYAARRLGSARVGMIWTSPGDWMLGRSLPLEVALTPESLSPGSMQRVRLGPLSLAAIRAIIVARLGVAPARRTLLHIMEMSGGNPFFALELAQAALDAGEESDLRFGPPTRPFDAALSRRIARLSAAGRSTAAAAAALGAPTVETLCLVAGASDWEAAGGAEVEAAGVITVHEGGVVRIIQPPLAASAYASTTDIERRELHRRLATMALDSVERARHLALASPGPNLGVAQILDAASCQASDRGAYEAAAELAEAALRLTPSARVVDRRRRRLSAADCLAAAGDLLGATTRLNEALVGMAPGPERGEVLRRLAVVLLSSNPVGDGRDILRQARSEAADDPALVAAIERDLCIGSLLLADVGAACHHADAALRAAAASGIDALVSGATTTGRAAAMFAGHPGEPGWFDRGEAAPGGPIHLALPVALSAWPARLHDNLDDARRLLRVAATVTGRGVREDLAVRCELAEVEVGAGKWELARAHADAIIEAFELLDDQAGVARGLAIRGRVGAATGRLDDARADLARALEITSGRGVDLVRVGVLAALGFLEITIGADDSAVERLERMTRQMRALGLAEPAMMPWVPDCIEAMIAVRDRDGAQDLLSWYDTLASSSGRASARACSLRCQSLLAAGDGDLIGAGALIEAAVDISAALPYPLEHGRNLLIRGSLERRRKLKGTARQSVTESIEVFDQLGATAWADRARQELHRLEPSRTGPDGLTALEARVAEHVLNRLSAREMATQLFVSRRTVEGTLGRLYGRYGVHSRAELRLLLVDGVGAQSGRAFPAGT